MVNTFIVCQYLFWLRVERVFAICKVRENDENFVLSAGFSLK